MQVETSFTRPGLLRFLALAVALCLAPLPLAAQQPTGGAKAESAQPDAAKTDAAPAPAQPAAPETGKSETVAPASEDGSIKEEDVVARVAIETRGAASWEDGYAKINEAIAKLRAAAQKAGLKENGRPMAVFTDTDDAGFKFDAMLPVDSPADAKPDLGADVTLAQTPSGKALRFQHRGAYDDIDATYEAITAYLDEKGLEARNLFAEEYLNDAKDSGDTNFQVDIHVFLK
jgi:effector-binding domain-containing protein